MTDATRPTDDEVPFAREERFIVIKRKHLTQEKEFSVRRFLRHQGVEPVECVVVEADWPEYEKVWQMIEARCTGRTSPQPHIAAEPGEVERVAMALYQCEKERSDHVDRLLSAAKGQPVKFRMEHWDDVADLYRSDARAALATLTAAEPRAAGEGALADEVEQVAAIIGPHLRQACGLNPDTDDQFRAQEHARAIARRILAALRQPSTERESVRKEAFEVERVKHAFRAGWTAHERGSDIEAFAPYPPHRCGEALDFYLCSLTDRNLTAQPHPGKEQE